METISLSVVCYQSKVLKSGKSPLMLKISKGKRRCLKNLGVTVFPEDWDSERSIPKRRCPDRNAIIQLITTTISKYQSKLLNSQASGENVSVASLIEDSCLASSITVEYFMEKLITDLRKENKVGNSNAYMNLKSILSNFIGHSLNFTFADIDVKFCERFEKWMRKNNYTDVSMHYYFRTLRATYNRAVNSKCVSADSSPFREYKLSRFNTKTKKRSLSKASLNKIVNFDSSQRERIIRLAHDIFLFSYYCGGISFTDIAHLTSENIVDGRLCYDRQKTHGEINLPLLDKAKEIIGHYEDEQKQRGYLFPILDKTVHITPMQQYNRVRKLLKQVNTALKTIYEELQIPEHVTTYVARHTFATVLKRSGVNVGVISQALGHQNIQTTQIYLDSFDNEQIDSAMQKLVIT